MEADSLQVRFRGKFIRASHITKLKKTGKNLKRGILKKDTEGIIPKKTKTGANFKIGRRIIDIDYFGKKFDDGCSKCATPLKWRDLVGECHYGLCVSLNFMCDQCSHINKVYSSQQASGSFGREKRRKPFSINVKAALAMIHGGIGPDILNAILSVLGLPTIDKKTLKRRERDIGPVIETVAKESCFLASETEKIMELNAGGDNQENVNKVSLVTGTSEQMDDHGDDEHMTLDEILDYLEDDKSSDKIETDTQTMEEKTVGYGSSFQSKSEKEDQYANISLIDSTHNQLVCVGVSQDGAWPKRGRAMNSMSGVGTVCGEMHRKCLGYTTRNKGCKKCTSLIKDGKTPTHDGCRRNWDRSARAMEADMAVQLHKEAANAGLKYKRVIGDEDSTAIKHIREKVNSEIEKYSDLVHIKRNINEKLRPLQSRYKQLSEKVIQAFINNFASAVHQNRTKTEEELIKQVVNITAHMYGEHEDCGKWCSYSKDPIGYHHKNLPHGRDLTDKALRQEFDDIIRSILKNPNKLMTTGDSQPNESLNNIIFTKAPKIRNYTQSESFDFRVAAGVCQFNGGTSYVNSVLNEAMLSPRKETEPYTMRSDRKRKYEREYKSLRSSKRRRNILKSERRKSDTKSRIKFDIGYEHSSG